MAVDYREELSEEGKRLWDQLNDVAYTTIDRMKSHTTTKKTDTARIRERIREIVVETDESQRLRLELRKLQQNSRIVVIDCTKQVDLFTKREEYFKANAKDSRLLPSEFCR